MKRKIKGHKYNIWEVKKIKEVVNINAAGFFFDEISHIKHE